MKLFKRHDISEDIIKNIKSRFIFKRLLGLILGLLVLSLAFNLFLYPNQIVYGGVTGLSIITDDLFQIEPAIFMLGTSMVLLVLSYFALGKEVTAGSAIGSLLYPLFINLTEPLYEIIDLTGAQDEPILIAVFGGLLTGIGAGLIFKSGFSTGGTDILNQIVSKYGKVSLGKSMLMTDGVIVLIGGFIFGWVQVMYAVIVLYIISIMTDKVVLGISQSKAFYISTKKEKEVTSYIVEKLGHSVTLLDARGGYTGNKQNMLLTVIPTSEYFLFKEGILEIDSSAFFVVTDSYEVQGGE